MKNRIAATLISLLILILVFTSCASPSKSVTVRLTVGDGIMLEDVITLPENANAAEYIRQLCNKNDVEIKGVDEGYITKVGEWENNDTYAWMFYINEELAEVGTDDYLPTSEDVITLSYLDWTTMF